MGSGNLLIKKIKGHIKVLIRVDRLPQPYNRMNGWEIRAYLEKMTIRELERENSELQMKRFRYNV